MEVGKAIMFFSKLCRIMLFMLLIVTAKPVYALRHLKGNQNAGGLTLNINATKVLLGKGPVPPSAPNACPYIPVKGVCGKGK
ncbi:hypothetical protein I3842_03G251300 [Carya illinoinensis]|uniref:Transmembrane protein n=1 Tax=Carya illinoinensis TaxID=32201 RepID=A0A922FPP0_CARIL|nr:hypothetical protein I3842_03G251300 [Carya illinoinensis]